MKKLVKVYILLFLFISCSPSKEVTHSFSPVTVSQFLEEPFGKEEGVATLKNQFSKDVKIKKLLRRNIHDSQKVDTIFEFYHHKSKVIVYKTYFNREMIFGGIIYDKKFPLLNGVTPGMNRDDFYKAFIDLKPEITDSVKIESKESQRKFNFIFDSKGRLKKINFSFYID